MIRLGLRLTLGSGREAALRVLVTAAAVALGVGLLLASLAGFNGLHAQNERGAWLNTSAPASASTPITDRLWWLSGTDQFGSQEIDEVQVAALGPKSPIPPGLSHLPGPGQYDASPSLAALLRTQPSDALAARYPGHQIGTIGAAGLPSPNSLVIVIGRTAGALSRAPGAMQISAIARTPGACYACQNAVGSGPVLEFILAVGAVALLLPVLILIATASRLSAARREERLAAMRLVGATPAQISTVAAVEAVVAAAVGVAIGFALFFAFEPLLTRVPFTGAPFAPGDLSLHWIDVALALVGVPIAAVISALVALRRVQGSPLGVQRRATAKPPGIIRLVPLVAGIALLAYFDAAGKPDAIGGQLLELLVGFMLLIVGLVLAGPWFTTAGSRLLARRANRPATLIAARRLLDNPKGAFRFISGLVIALFVASAVIGALSSVAAVSSRGGSNAAEDTVAILFCSYSTTNCPASAQVHSVSAQVLSDIRATPGVGAVTVIHDAESQPTSGSQSAPGNGIGQPSEPPGREHLPARPGFGPVGHGFGVVACDQLAHTPALGKCAPGATEANIGYFLSNILGHHANASSTTWPTAHLAAAAVARIPPDGLVISTNGSAGAVERARTVLERDFPFEGTPITVEALDPSTARLLAMIQAMTDVMIVASLIIAACSLAVNIAAGLGERKRPFSLLRLTGVPTSLLHRVVAMESALPLFLVAGVSIVVGLVSAGLFLHSQVGIAFHAPGLTYWATVAGGMVASMAIIASTFPLLNRITGPEVARND